MSFWRVSLKLLGCSPAHLFMERKDTVPDMIASWSIACQFLEQDPENGDTASSCSRPFAPPHRLSALALLS